MKPLLAALENAAAEDRGHPRCFLSRPATPESLTSLRKKPKRICVNGTISPVDKQTLHLLLDGCPAGH